MVSSQLRVEKEFISDELKRIMSTLASHDSQTKKTVVSITEKKNSWNKKLANCSTFWCKMQNFIATQSSSAMCAMNEPKRAWVVNQCNAMLDSICRHFGCCVLLCRAGQTERRLVLKRNCLWLRCCGVYWMLLIRTGENAQRTARRIIEFATLTFASALKWKCRQWRDDRGPEHSKQQHHLILLWRREHRYQSCTMLRDSVTVEQSAQQSSNEQLGMVSFNDGIGGQLFVMELKLSTDSAA